jgi:DNA-binding transcriptional MerR regulator
MKPQIPDKLFFRIGDVARIAEVEPHVLRYWESEFNILNPVKNNTGQRVYRKRDVEKVLEIKSLLYQERYSIEGAKKKLNTRKKVAGGQDNIKNTISSVKKELQEILNILNK